MSDPSRHMLTVDSSRQTLIKIGFTAILVGYLMVWLPGKAAGLSFLGLEIGEWVKFLPQVRSGQVVADRNLFYLPPITLGSMLTLWTTAWPTRRWQTWAARALAVLVAMLAFPSLEVILEEGTDQWLLRVVLVLFVMILALVVSQLNRLPNGLGLTVSWGAILVLALVGLILPTWAYLAVRPAIISLFADDVGFGPGLWLNGIGNLLVAFAALTRLLEQRNANFEHSA